MSLITAFGIGDLAVPGRMSKDQLLALITGVNLALVVLAFLLKPAGFSWSWGAFLALAAAIVAFCPLAFPSSRTNGGAESLPYPDDGAFRHFSFGMGSIPIDIKRGSVSSRLCGANVAECSAELLFRIVGKHVIG